MAYLSAAGVSLSTDAYVASIGVVRGGKAVMPPKKFWKI